jgi:hypothetical protein
MRNGVQGSVFGQYFTSSCLKFDDLWYNAFEIGLGETTYKLSLTVSFYNKTTNLQVDETAILSPQSTVASSADGQVLGQIVGDLASFKAAPVLADNLFFYPSYPPSHPRVQEGYAGSMVLDKLKVDLTGASPNKVGVSFLGFQSQANACGSTAGSGLQNQLEDYYQADKDRVTRGLAPRSFASRFGNDYVRRGDGERFLSYKTEFPGNTVVSLSINADSIAFVTNNSPGKISAAYVLEFESLSKNGVMHVLVSNIGAIAADFYVSVIECTPNILPVLEQKRSIGVYRSIWVDFAIVSTVELGSVDNRCIVELKDSLFQVQDRVVVYFNTSDLVQDAGAQAGNAPNNSAGSSSVGAGPVTSCSGCGYFDVPCHIANSCLTDILKSVGTVALPAIGILLALKILSSPTVRGSLLRCCRGRRVVYETVPQETIVMQSSKTAPPPRGLLSLTN